MKKILGIIVLILLALGIYQFTNNKNTKPSLVDGQEITIGAPLSLSGMAVVDGESLRDGINLAVADYAKEGVNINVKFIDDQSETKETLTAMNLLASQNVDAVVGPTWSFLYSAAVPVADREKLVTIGPAITSEYAETGEYGFQLTPKISYSEDQLVDFLTENKIKSISYLATQYAWSEAHLENLQNAAKRAEVSIDVEWMQFGEEVGALDTLVSKIKVQDPDLIFFEGGGDAVYTKLFNRLNQNKLTIPVMTATSDMTRYISENKEVISDNQDIYVLTGLPSDSFANYFQKQNGRYPGEYVEYGYDAVKIIVQGIRENSRENLKEYIENNSFEGFTKTYSFDENHDAANGEWVIRKDN